MRHHVYWEEPLTSLEQEKKKGTGEREAEGQKYVEEAISGKEGLEKTWSTCGFLHALIHHEKVEK